MASFNNNAQTNADDKNTQDVYYLEPNPTQVNDETVCASMQIIHGGVGTQAHVNYPEALGPGCGPGNPDMSDAKRGDANSHQPSHNTSKQIDQEPCVQPKHNVYQ